MKDEIVFKQDDIEKIQNMVFPLDFALRELTAIKGSRLQNTPFGFSKECVYDSLKENLPYLCFSLIEYFALSAYVQEKEPFEKAETVFNLLENYVSPEYSHHKKLKPFYIKKAQYWVDKTLEHAKNGDIFSKALVAKICNHENCAVLNLSTAQKYCEEFEHEVEKLSTKGSKEAQYSSAYFLDYNKTTEEQRVLYEKSAEQGFYKSCEKLYHRFKTGNKYALLGAELGSISLQEDLGVCYNTGENGFPVDKEKALYWAKKAMENGSEWAKDIKECIQNQSS